MLRGGGDTVSDHFKHSANQGISYSIPYGGGHLTTVIIKAITVPVTNSPVDLSLNWMVKVKSISYKPNGYCIAVRKIKQRRISVLARSSQHLTELQMDFNRGTRIANSYLDLDLGYQKGISALDAQNNNHLKGSEPVARYKKYSITTSFLKPFKLYDGNFSFDSLLYYQKSEDVLFSPQRISLSGISSVRGFKD